MGSKVTVLEYMDGITPGIDREVAKKFQQILTKQGMKILTGQKVTGHKRVDGQIQVEYESVKDGKASQIAGDVVLVSTGRRPFTDGLGLDKVGIKMDNRGRIEIDDLFRTNV